MGWWSSESFVGCVAQRGRPQSGKCGYRCEGDIIGRFVHFVLVMVQLMDWWVDVLVMGEQLWREVRDGKKHISPVFVCCSVM